MSAWKKVFSSLAVLSIPVSGYAECDGTWTGAVSSDWNNPSNWNSNPSGCRPGTSVTAPLDRAFFPAGGLTPVNQNFVATLGSMDFLGGQSYIINGPNPIAFGSSGFFSETNLTSNGGTQTFNTEVVLVDNTTLLGFFSGSSTIAFNDPVFIQSSGLSISNFTSPVSPITVNFNNNVVLSPLDAASSISVANSNPFTNETGNTINFFNNLNLANDVQIFIDNYGTIDATSGTAAGNKIQFANLTLADGSFFSSTNANGSVTASIGQNAEGNSILITGQLDVSGGFDLINSQSVSGPSAGNSLNVNDTTDIGPGASIEILNEGSVDGINGNAFGNTANFFGLVTMSGGSFSNTNSGTVTASGGSQGTGSSLFFPSGLNISGGTITNANQGNIAGGQRGAVLSVTNGFNISGTGQVVNKQNTGTLSGGSIGSAIFADTITITGPNATLWNDDFVHPSSGTINVNGGNLKGIGIYNAGVVNNGGTVFPISNDSIPGTMTILGNYTQSPSGTLEVSVVDEAHYSKLAVSGTADISGSNLVVNDLSDIVVNLKEQFVILTADSINGEFASVKLIGPDTVKPKVTYDTDTEVILFFVPALGSPSGLGPSYAGGFVQTLITSINSINSRLTLQMEQMRRRFGAELNAPTPLSLNRFEKKDSLITSNDDSFLAINPQTEEKQEQLRREVSKQEIDRPWNFYFGPLGRTGELHTKKDEPKMDYWSAGALAGFDYAFEQVGVGFLGNYEHIDFHVKDKWGKVQMDEFQASLYSSYAPKQLPELAINGIVGSSYELYYIRRNTGLPMDILVAKGTPHGFSFDALFGLEYAFENRQFNGMPKGLQIIPLASLQYVYLHVDHYRERNAGDFDMKVHDQRVKSLRSELGLRVNYTLQRTNFSFVPEIYAEWQREYLNKSRHLNFISIFDPTDTTTLTMPGTGRNIAIGGADVLFTFFDKYGVEASYEYEWNSLFHDNFFYLGTNFRF